MVSETYQSHSQLGLPVARSASTDSNDSLSSSTTSSSRSTSPAPSLSGINSTHSGKSHRRVKSLVREFDAININDWPAAYVDHNGSVAQHGRRTASSNSTISSTSSLARSPDSTFTATTRPEPDTSLSTDSSSSYKPASVPLQTGVQKPIMSFSAADATASSSAHAHINGRATGLASPFRSHARTSSTVSANGHARSHSHSHAGHSHSHSHSHDEQLEEEEADDAFVPLTSEAGDYAFVGATSPRSPNSLPHSRTSSANGLVFIDPKANMTEAERRAHSRRHSRVHSRNLSVFFPRPGVGSPGIQDISEEIDDESSQAQVIEIPSHDHSYASQARITPQTAYSSEGSDRQRMYSANSDPAHEEAATSSSKVGRRGHHHRHSLSHNFFSFLDPTQTNPELASASAGSSIPSVYGTPIQDSAYLSGLQTPSSIPRPVASPMGLATSHPASAPSGLPASSSYSSKYAHLPRPIRLTLVLLFQLQFRVQAALVLSIAEIVMGSTLWIAGQAGESLATTGLGYLLVFDGFGALSSVIVEGSMGSVELLWEALSSHKSKLDKSIRWPYGTHRLTTLSHFAQCVFLIFSAVYVCKEAIEHVLLLHDPLEAQADAGHGSAHGTMGHGESLVTSPGADLTPFGPALPTPLLICSFAACLASAIILGNHAKLIETVGPATYALRPIAPGQGRKPRLRQLLDVLSNPFSLLVLVFSGTLYAAGLFLTPVQLTPLDKILALIESLAMFYVGYPAAMATGKVLLQTAPPVEAGNMAALKRGVREVESHPLVVHVPPPHIWQLTPHPRTAPNARKSKIYGRASLPSPSDGASIIIVTLEIHVRMDASDSDILDLTQMARQKCSPALSRSTGGGSIGGPAGELTVKVRRTKPALASQPVGHVHTARDHCGLHDHSHAAPSSQSHSHGHSHAHA
ncbi:uncharacterized protein L969DRAFT_89367 [Mixia osmundae IAM 14324]|nr:uncharacterized protein L969DRAFT_89367 [Mixia osmundae IAM 14324]KEI38122.1 hypothetical protein L969DRAFT_89367 [Mixia osmundae IAM 14324]